MKPEWQSFLTDAGAEWADQRIVSFGNPERERSVVVSGNILCDLSHCGLIAAHGEEALRFLQSQFSSDVNEVSITHSQLSSYLSPKGRTLSCFRLFKRGDSYYLHLPRSMLEATLKQLRKYVLRAKLTLEDASDALVRCGYSGPNAERELEQALGAYPARVDDCVAAGDTMIVRVPGPHPRFEIYGELAPMKKLWSILNVRGAPVGASPWALLDILAGIPNVFPTTSDRFVPQMLNLHLLGGVSFKKGCYPGQEVVARMRYLGTLKRRMYRLHLAGDIAPQPGEAIFRIDGDAAEPSGAIVDAQPHPDGVEILAVLRTADAEGHTLRLQSPDGAPLELRKLPYEF